jgi:hypothetical protein
MTLSAGKHRQTSYIKVDHHLLGSSTLYRKIENPRPEEKQKAEQQRAEITETGNIRTSEKQNVRNQKTETRNCSNDSSLRRSEKPEDEKLRG